MNQPIKYSHLVFFLFFVATVSALYLLVSEITGAIYQSGYDSGQEDSASFCELESMNIPSLKELQMIRGGNGTGPSFIPAIGGTGNGIPWTQAN